MQEIIGRIQEMVDRVQGRTEGQRFDCIISGSGSGPRSAGFSVTLPLWFTFSFLPSLDSMYRIIHPLTAKYDSNHTLRRLQITDSNAQQVLVCMQHLLSNFYRLSLKHLFESHCPCLFLFFTIISVTYPSMFLPLLSLFFSLLSHHFPFLIILFFSSLPLHLSPCIFPAFRLLHLPSSSTSSSLGRLLLESRRLELNKLLVRCSGQCCLPLVRQQSQGQIREC